MQWGQIMQAFEHVMEMFNECAVTLEGSIIKVGQVLRS